MNSTPVRREVLRTSAHAPGDGGLGLAVNVTLRFRAESSAKEAETCLHPFLVAPRVSRFALRITTFLKTGSARRVCLTKAISAGMNAKASQGSATQKGML